ncbi:hypothetical protein BDZ45DRAFT_108364 [Acephala macrosclerotiorum]|nr:hypothetical protein BDZ45DRAFT_108364 [Acephala macrosclerotiorum]
MQLHANLVECPKSCWRFKAEAYGLEDGEQAVIRQDTSALSEGDGLSNVQDIGKAPGTSLPREPPVPLRQSESWMKSTRRNSTNTKGIVSKLRFKH